MWLEQESAICFSDGPDNKNLRLCRSDGLCRYYSTLSCHAEATAGKKGTQSNESDCVLTEFYLQKQDSWPGLWARVCWLLSRSLIFTDTKFLLNMKLNCKIISALFSFKCCQVNSTVYTCLNKVSKDDGFSQKIFQANCNSKMFVYSKNKTNLSYMISLNAVL